MRFPTLVPTLFTFLVLAAGSSAGIAPSPEAASPINPGVMAPEVRILDAAGESVALSAVLGGKPTILIFYRGGWCPYCNKHLAQLAELEDQFLELGYQIVGISPDPVSALTQTAEKEGLGYRLFSDRSMEASAAFGLAFRVDDKTVERYKEYNIDLAPVPGKPAARWLPVPAAVIVDAKGIIRFVHAEADYKTRISDDDLMAAARAAIR